MSQASHLLKTLTLPKLTDVVGLSRQSCGAMRGAKSRRSSVPSPACPGRLTHDYKRHGTTTLRLDGCVMCMPRHVTKSSYASCGGWTSFRKNPPSSGPGQLRDPHRAQRAGWLDKHPRFTLHFIYEFVVAEPGGRELTEKRVRRSFESVPELIAAIEQYLAARTPTPNRSWHTSADPGQAR